MITAITRARLIGAALLVASFAAGVAVGFNLPPRQRREGVTIMVKGTTDIPEELDDLQLTDSQRALIRGFLRDGTLRIGNIVREFTAPIDAAVDTTDRQIRSVLSQEQNRLLDQFRRDHPLKRMEERRIIDTIRH